MKKKIAIIVIAAIVLITAVAAIYFALLKPDTKGNKKANLEKGIDQAITDILDKDVTEADLKKITGLEDVKPAIILGKDSDLQEKPNSDLIKKYDLKKYEKAQKTYVDEVEEAYLKNLKYKLNDSIKNEKGEIVQEIELRSFYYQMFINDWSSLAIKILEKAGGDLKKLETDEKTQIAFYKAKVKALEIMSSYIKDYQNSQEKITFSIICKDGKPKDKKEMNKLLSNLRGMTYNAVDFSVKDNVDAYQARVDNYYEVAKTQQILDENSPLKLKG